MTPTGRAASTSSVLGREPELEAFDAFVGGAPALAAFVLTGGPGIGKTTLWEAGIRAARDRGIRVLTSRASAAEAQLAFAAVIDLLDGVDLEALSLLPVPQRRALAVALLRAEPTGAASDPQAVARGFLNALKALATEQPLVVAIDDIQWLDSPSADTLAFAARRLEDAGVRFLLARRPGDQTVLERELERGVLAGAELGPLSLGATRRLLSDRLGLSLPRVHLRRLHDASLGNPLFALEVARILVERGQLEIGDDLPVSDTIEHILGTRVTRLPHEVRRLLLAVALNGELRLAQIAALADGAALDPAVELGVLQVDGDRVRPSHPLLAAAARGDAPAPERRAMHQALAGVAADEELRALHLALATELPDADLAGSVARAAETAAARGARQRAVELADHSLRLTPLDALERADRLLSLARYLGLAGEYRRLADLLLLELDALPGGEPRVRAYLLLTKWAQRSEGDHEAFLQRALEEAGIDPRLRSLVLPSMIAIQATNRLEGLRETEMLATEAAAAARLVGPDIEREAVEALAWTRGLRGLPVDDLCDRVRVISKTAVQIAASPERIAGQRLAWRGEIDRARAVHAGLQALADEQGESVSFAVEVLHQCELELRAGRWEAAALLLDELEADASDSLRGFPIFERCRALLAAGRGAAEEAERWAARVVARTDARTSRWDLFEALRARGIAELLRHRPSQAADSLGMVWEHTQREGIDEPGVFPVAPDLVEALFDLGRLDEAEVVTARLRGLAEEQAHPWGLIGANRCAALIRLAAPAYDEEAAAELAGTAAAYGELGLLFDRARTLLSLGRAQRRSRKWAAARESLESAAAAFEALGSPGWVEAARSELTRVGGRRRSRAELTETEDRVARLAADGLSNREIASALFVTENTVEAHLSHAYAKLGIGSRAQLARRLTPPSQSPL